MLHTVNNGKFCSMLLCLFEQALGFRKQTNILYGNDRLIRKCFHKLNLTVTEGLGFDTANEYYPNDLILTQQWHREKGAVGTLN